MKDGFLLIDKESDYTSRDVCNIIAKIFDAKKVGHAGTLDPFATGLFISNRNKRICIRAAQNLVTKYNTSLKHITMHKLRSTFATNLYQATGDIACVAEALGHEDVNTTKKHYAHISEDIKRKNRNLVSYETEGDDT